MAVSGDTDEHTHTYTRTAMFASCATRRHTRRRRWRRQRKRLERADMDAHSRPIKPVNLSPAPRAILSLSLSLLPFLLVASLLLYDRRGANHLDFRLSISGIIRRESSACNPTLIDPQIGLFQQSQLRSYKIYDGKCLMIVRGAPFHSAE